MNATNKLTLSQVVWYFLPGMYAEMVILIPVAVIFPSKASEIMKVLGAVGFALVGLVIGFFIDGLRLYQLRPGYDEIRANFYSDLQRVLGSEKNVYFLLDQVVEYAEKEKNHSVRFGHSIWIMLGQMTALTWLNVSIWIIIAIFYWVIEATPSFFGFNMSLVAFILLCVQSAFVAFVLGRRLMLISIKEQKKANAIYLEFANAHRDAIRKMIGETNNVR
ncbi:MAG: hypothetical protein ACOZF2_11415 [Thermodesulfobacteriota bacterium]